MTLYNDYDYNNEERDLSNSPNNSNSSYFDLLPLNIRGRAEWWELKRKEIEYVLISGGSGDLYHPENKEAEILRRYLTSIDWNTRNFLFESESRNTFENAKYSALLLKEKFISLENKKILLITSAGHMRRSIACFKAQGIEVDYLCSNRFSGSRKFEFQHCFIPNMGAFSGWNHLLHEMVGYITYQFTGKI